VGHYKDFQNKQVKHGDNAKETDVEFIIEMTSAVMKYIIKIIDPDVSKPPF